ncbi:EamA family transporter [Ferruginibacter albus]|uniref:EamA family transporter n=1 Tax=Ferruginibacter albus TaxID=2875540 RepID=UPI001CC4944E|nr:EamA family transporter [Ferruginibacter albus]UAY51219.1 EamA family transporter [Ferruginibacter albus]
MEITSTSATPSKSLVIAAFAAVYLIWGSTYVAIVLALKTVPPFLLAGIRFFGAGLILYAWCIAKGDKTPNIISILKNSLAGILMLFCGTTALIWSELYLPSGVAAIVVASVPLWMILLDKKHWEINFSDKFIVIGLLIGFSGIILLFNGKTSLNLHDHDQLIAFVVLLIGSMLWSAGSLYSKYAASEGTTSMKASIQMLAAGLSGFIVAFAVGEQKLFAWQQISTSSMLAIIYLITFGSLVGYIAYIWLLSVRSAALVGTYAYINPVVAMFLGWLLVSETISFIQVIALIVILVGVLLVNFSKYKKY